MQALPAPRLSKPARLRAVGRGRVQPSSSRSRSAFTERIMPEPRTPRLSDRQHRTTWRENGRSGALFRCRSALQGYPGRVRVYLSMTPDSEYSHESAGPSDRKPAFSATPRDATFCSSTTATAAHTPRFSNAHSVARRTALDANPFRRAKGGTTYETLARPSCRTRSSTPPASRSSIQIPQWRRGPPSAHPARQAQMAFTMFSTGAGPGAANHRICSRSSPAFQGSASEGLRTLRTKPSPTRAGASISTMQGACRTGACAWVIYRRVGA
jgi:hypothetical protein